MKNDKKYIKFLNGTNFLDILYILCGLFEIITLHLQILILEKVFVFCFICFVLFAIFILHSRESELYRYTLDSKSALAWELPFSRFMGHLSST